LSGAISYRLTTTFITEPPGETVWPNAAASRFGPLQESSTGSHFEEASVAAASSPSSNA
jgi:hypothetical protein